MATRQAIAPAAATATPLAATRRVDFVPNANKVDMTIR